jgi:hypothetical protein
LPNIAGDLGLNFNDRHNARLCVSAVIYLPALSCCNHYY